MTALIACRFNPDLKAKYQQLREAGKPAKVAITAVICTIGKSASQIMQIIGVIDEIAFQTKLLAMNSGVDRYPVKPSNVASSGSMPPAPICISFLMKCVSSLIASKKSPRRRRSRRPFLASS